MSKDSRLTTIVSLLKKERLIKGYSQEYVALRLGVKQNTYSRIESGTKQPTQAQLTGIAKVLEFKLEELFQLFE